MCPLPAVAYSHSLGDLAQPNEPHTRSFLGSGFGRTDFSRIFIFGPLDFFADFLAGLLSPQFFGKKCPEKKTSRKIPAKILQNLYNKNPPTHFCRLAGTKFLLQPCHYVYEGGCEHIVHP